ncbi:MAG: tRNA (guanosine(37)-N1)-methyltransferase TrmD [Anaerolineae bacterium]
MRIDIFTLFPEMFLGPLQESILKRAQERGILNLFLHQIRDYAFDRHQMTDDLPYGGGQGMVMKPEPVFRAVHAVVDVEQVPIVLLSPQGRTFTQSVARELAQESQLALICGHYEGVDERVRQHLVTDELSIGDYVLTGGELAAMVVVDAVARFVPGVLGAADGAQDDSYALGLLEGPQYTRPATFEAWSVPEVLRSGDHAAIARWRRAMALRRTLERRPDMLDAADLSAEDRELLAQIEQWTQTEPGLREPDDI